MQEQQEGAQERRRGGGRRERDTGEGTNEGAWMIGIKG
jgi:hypothetical protein